MLALKEATVNTRNKKLVIKKKQERSEGIFNGLCIKLEFLVFVLEIDLWLFYRLYLRSLYAD
jgi:hypothetical protein